MVRSFVSFQVYTNILMFRLNRLDFPTHSKYVLFNNLILPYRWLLWTSQNLIGLDPKDGSLRERLSNSVNILGTAAGLFLVIAATALLTPPGVGNPNAPPQIIVDAFGICMWISTSAYIGYIAFALTVFHPISQSLRDDVLFDAYERYMRRWGGYELFLFDIGLHFMIFGLVLGCYILYSRWALVGMVIISGLMYSSIIFLSRECFLSLDPISAMHLGLTNKYEHIERAEKLSRYLLYKIPNNILQTHDDNSARLKRLLSPRVPHPSETTAAVNTEKMTTQEAKESTESVETNMRTVKNDSTAQPSKDTTRNQQKNTSKSVFDVSQKLLSPKPSNKLKTARRVSIIEKEREELKSRLELAVPAPTIQSELPEVALPNDLPEIFSSGNYLLAKVSLRDCESVYDKLYKRGFTTTEQVLEYLNETKQLSIACNCDPYQHFIEEQFKLFDQQPLHWDNQQDHEKKKKKNLLNRVKVLPFSGAHSDGEHQQQPLINNDDDESDEEDEDDGSVAKHSTVRNFSVLHGRHCPNRLVSCWMKSLEKLDIPSSLAYELILLLKPYLI
jgi:hypothetical protein